MNSQRLRNSSIYLLLLLALTAFLYTALVPRTETPAASVSMDQIATLIRTGDVRQITIQGDQLLIVKRSGDQIASLKESGVGLIGTLQDLGVPQEQLMRVDIRVAELTGWAKWGGLLMALLPLLLIGLFFFFILRQAQGAGNQAFSFGKSKARMFTGDKPTVTFDDVAGNEEAKQELEEVVEFLKEPQKFASLGARIPKGVLLVGPPGTGKTLVAKAVSGEAGVPFFNISGSEFVEMFVGVGASRVRDLFEQAKKNSPCIIFIDEIDAVGRHRGAGMGGSHDEREQTLNQILVEMDGFDTDTNIIIIAATNRPDILDPALLRPGRFDRQVTMDAPDVKGRRAILDVHSKGKPLASDVDLDIVARQTPGFVGADIENLVNEAAILAARRNRRSISLSEFQEAIERVLAGPERRSRLISPKEKEIIAYHEAGHALLMYYMPGHDPVHKITIVPRGMAGGYTMSIPEEEGSRNVTVERYKEQLVALLGGRVAEEVRFNDITTGASNDLERVTKMVRSMVTQWGMSEKLGPIQYGQQEDMVFLGRTIHEYRNYSDKTAKTIDNEVRLLVDEAHDRATQIITEHRDKLDLVAQRLLEVETVLADEFERLMDPNYAPDRSVQPNPPQPVPQPSAEATSRSKRRGEDEDRSDKGVNLGGTLPAPA